MNTTLGLWGICVGLVIAGCGDDGNTGGSGAGGSPSGGSAQGAGSQGAGSQGGDGPAGGASQGGASQGGASQGGASQGGASQGGASQGGSAQGGSAQGGAGQGGGGTGGGAPVFTCQTGCEALFDCALENDSGGNQNCPGLQAADQAFVVPGCVQQCTNNMGLLAFIDPSDCEGTIDTFSSISAQFDNACQNGL